MEPLSLITICSLAFGVVFTVLTALAVSMWLITSLFPEREAALDPTVVAAISTTVASVIPGARVTRIEEER